MTDNNEQKARTSITIDPELLEQTKKASKQRDQSVSQFISTAIKRFLEEL